MPGIQIRNTNLHWVHIAPGSYQELRASKLESRAKVLGVSTVTGFLAVTQSGLLKCLTVSHRPNSAHCGGCRGQIRLIACAFAVISKKMLPNQLP